MTTTAEEISERFSDDGQCFTDGDGNSLEDVLCSAIVATHCGERCRYEFSDGSAIVIASEAWDLGFSGTGCLCWQGVGHRDDCAHA
jgi:hypothetical protein